jgi:hypothetical protein
MSGSKSYRMRGTERGGEERAGEVVSVLHYVLLFSSYCSN